MSRWPSLAAPPLIAALGFVDLERHAPSSRDRAYGAAAIAACTAATALGIALQANAQVIVHCI